MLATIKGKKVEIGKTDFFCGDKNADKIYFCFPLEYETLSLEGVPVYIKTKNALGGHSKASLKSFKVSNELYVEWILGAEATAVCGKLLCQLVFEKEDGSVIFNTDTFYVYIGESISDNAPGVILETNHITQLQNQMQELIKNYKALAEGDYVVSVNGESGTVLITPEKIGALASGAAISLLTNDANYVSVADIQSGIQTHNNSESAHADIRTKIQELTSAASSATGNKMRLFSTLSEMITALNLHASTVFKSGDVLKVVVSGIPGFYVRSVESGQSAYSYVSDAATIKDAYLNGYIQVGYYKISVEEGYKQDVLGKSGSVSLSAQNWVNNVYTLTLSDLGDYDAVFFTPASRDSKTQLENANVLIRSMGQTVTFVAQTAPDADVALDYFISRGN